MLNSYKVIKATVAGGGVKEENEEEEIRKKGHSLRRLAAMPSTNCF